VYYGVSPEAQALARVRAPVLGLYGGDDARVTGTVPAAMQEMKRLGKRYETEIYTGAGHAFLPPAGRQRRGQPARCRAAWPRTIEFLKETLDSRSSRKTPKTEILIPAVFRRL